MYTNSLASSDTQKLAEALFPKADTNKDGQLSSDEFANFLTRLLQDLDTESAGASTGEAPSEGAPTAGSAISTGASPRMAGFDHGKMTTSTTLKYKFARVAQHHDLSAVRDSASAEAVLQGMKDELEAAGVRVLAFRGDEIQVVDDDGTNVWVDVVQGANSGHEPAFQWGHPRG